MKVRYTNKGNISIKLSDDEAQQIFHLVNFSGQIDYAGVAVDKTEVEKVSNALHGELSQFGFAS